MRHHATANNATRVQLSFGHPFYGIPIPFRHSWPDQKVSVKARVPRAAATTAETRRQRNANDFLSSSESGRQQATAAGWLQLGSSAAMTDAAWLDRPL